MQFNFLDEWGESNISYPVRSRLYNLPQIGSGTMMQEALVSYVARLANAHTEMPLRLINREIIPLTNIRFEKSSGNFGAKYAKTINSCQKYAQEISGAVTELTCQPGLEKATFLAWRDVLDPKGAGLLNEHPQWCPDCLGDWRDSQRDSYFPLLWYVKDIKHCPIHRVRLVSECPRCGEHQPFIPKHFHIDHCSVCGGWLGYRQESAESDLLVLSKYESYVMSAISEMISQGDQIKAYLSYSMLQGRLKAYMDKIAGGCYAEFERQLGFRKSVLTQWMKKDTRPQIRQFLLMCFRLKVSPVQFFLEEPSCNMKPIQGGFPSHVARRQVKLTAKQRQTLLENLQLIIEGDESITFREACKRLGYTNSYLRYWFPDQCQQILRKRREFVSQMTQDKKSHIRKTAYDLVFSLLSGGVWFNSKDVEILLRPSKLSLLNPIVREGVRQAKKDYFLNRNKSNRI